MISIIIPSLRRGESLERCIASIHENIYKDFQIIVKETKGLCQARNEGIREAQGRICTFIDDDTVVSKNWLENIAKSFEDKTVVGVTGATIIPNECLGNRDLIKFITSNTLLARIYNRIVLENNPFALGRFYKSGGFSIGSNFKWAKDFLFEFDCDWLESCNMSYRRDVLRIVGGFSLEWGGCGDCSEPDMAFKVRKYGRLVYNPRAYLYHYVSSVRGDIEDTYQRMSNFIKFHKKYFKMNFRYLFNLFFMNAYFIKKALETKNHKWLGGVEATWKCLSGI